MIISVDTNVLVRSVVGDDKTQAAIANDALKNASAVAVAIPALCEFVWVLRKVYDVSPADIAAALRALLNTANLLVNRPAVEAGVAILEAGGDFADGAIAYEGNWLGGETFVSFDSKAVSLLKEQGQSATLLAA